MYKVYAEQNGTWVEMGNSESFSDSWDYARVLRKDKTNTKVKVEGPEGSWEVK